LAGAVVEAEGSVVSAEEAQAAVEHPVIGKDMLKHPLRDHHRVARSAFRSRDSNGAVLIAPSRKGGVSYAGFLKLIR
jgi:hypothetical protein